MPSDAQSAAITEILTWLEQQQRQVRDDQIRAEALIDQLRRQIHDMSDQVLAVERGLREVDPKFVPYKGIPEKLAAIGENTEHLRQAITSHKAEMDNAIRLIRAEADYDREERAEAFKRIEQASAQIGLALADVAQLQSQVAQVSHTSSGIIERQREIEAKVEQFGLRLDRSIEVHRDLEERILHVLTADQEERFDVVFERLQVVGEMVKRNEDLIQSVVQQRDTRDDLIHEVAVFRDQNNRVDERLNGLEEVADRLLSLVDKVQGEIALLEGRHSGLGERVAGMRREIAEVVDHVREEFAKYNQMTEKQRRKQIQVLEQELREMKFHAFHPPEEPR